MIPIVSDLTFVDIHVGDKVKIVSQMVDFYFFYNETGTVTKNSHSYLGITVKFDEPRYFENGLVQTEFNFNPKNLELLKSKKKKSSNTDSVEHLKEAAKNLLDYRARNSTNFQLEKADDYFRELRAALECLPNNKDVHG